MIMRRHYLSIAVAASALAGLLFARQALGQQQGDAPAQQPPAALAPAPPPPAPAVTGQDETVIVTPPPDRYRVFDMRQCTEDGKFCRMATCVSVPRPDGAVYMCQSHGNFFP